MPFPNDLPYQDFAVFIQINDTTPWADANNSAHTSALAYFKLDKDVGGAMQHVRTLSEVMPVLRGLGADEVLRLQVMLQA